MFEACGCEFAKRVLGRRLRILVTNLFLGLALAKDRVYGGYGCHVPTTFGQEGTQYL